MSNSEYGLVLADLIEMLECCSPNVQVRVAFDAGVFKPAFQITHVVELHDGPRRPYNAIGDTKTLWLGVEQVDRKTESPTAPPEIWDDERING